MARTTANTAVTSATRREKWSSRRSCSSSGFGSSTSAIGPGTGRRSEVVAPAADLFPHGVSTCLEGRRQPLRLLFEVLAALVEETAGPRLGVARRLLRLPEEIAAALGEEVARLAPSLRRDQESGGRPRESAEK